MSLEFTGERVVPGAVDANLWNEHMARYAFASRLSRGRRVLDLGCGTGYGAAELARNATRVTGIDIAPDALAYAAYTYSAENVRWTCASCTALPFAASSFDLVVSFEVVEHIPDWPLMIAEARRVLSPGGQLVISTPNRLFYSESRSRTGPNPFHEHEFEFEEFRQTLRAEFPHVSLFLQDHAEGVLFRHIGGVGASELRIDGPPPSPEHANFFVGVCAMSPQTGTPAFVYLPSSANLLRERAQHIARLESEIRTKDAWRAGLQARHQELLDLHRAQTAELEARNQWAEQLDAAVRTRDARIVSLQDELAHEQAEAAKVVAAYEARIAELETEVAARTEWALNTEQRLTAEVEKQTSELSRCVELLHAAEQLAEERTHWAQQLDAERERLAAIVAMIAASRWIRLGRAIGMGPELQR